MCFELQKVLSEWTEPDKMTFKQFIDKHWYAVLAILIILILVVLNVAPFLKGRQKNRRSRRITISLVGSGEENVVKGKKFYPNVPEKEGYVFHGWFEDTAHTKPWLNSKVKRTLKLYPKWIKE